MPNSAENKGEKCVLDHSPCGSAYRYQVYDNARRCKRVTLKRCKDDPTKKKMCEASRKALSRLRKPDLCQYIVGNPAYHSEGHIFKKHYNKAGTLKKNVTRTIQREFFTPMDLSAEKAETRLKDAQRTLYLAKYSGPGTDIYEQKGGSKVYWTNYDEAEDIPLEGWRLTFPTEFERYVRVARRKGINRIFVNMRLFKRIDDTDDDSKHANFLVLDMRNNVIYRYEPSGYGDLYDVFKMDHLDRKLAEWGRKRGMKYVPPWDSCPTQLFGKVAALQRMAGRAQPAGFGFCKVWATFMLEQMLRHPEMEVNDLQKHLLKIFKDNNIDMTEFGHSYIQRVNQYGNRILREHGMKAGANPDEYLEKHWNPLMTKATKTA